VGVLTENEGVGEEGRECDHQPPESAADIGYFRHLSGLCEGGVVVIPEVGAWASWVEETVVGEGVSVGTPSVMPFLVNRVQM